MKFWIIITASLISIQINASSLNANDLSLALIEKSIFESNETGKINSLLLDKSSMEIELNRFDDAIRTISRIDTTVYSGEQINEYHWRRSMYLTLSEKFDQAMNELDQITSFNDSINNRVLLLKAFIFNEIENFEACRNLLISEKRYSNCLADTISLPVDANLKNPNTASRASGFFPGAGQFYAGKPMKGVLSFVLTAGFLSFGIYNFSQEFYVMSVVSGLFPSLKFYAGGKRLAYRLTEKENAARIQNIKMMYRNKIYELENCPEN